MDYNSFDAITFVFHANKIISFKNMDRQEGAKDSANIATSKLSATGLNALGAELCFVHLVDWTKRDAISAEPHFW